MVRHFFEGEAKIKINSLAPKMTFTFLEKGAEKTHSGGGMGVMLVVKGK
jgi:hypothetical protein